MNIEYKVKITEIKPENKKYWSQTLVEIYQDIINTNSGEIEESKKIGEYTRNYPSFAEDTFFPFKLNNNWYALYSEDYTATFVMSLPDCKKVAGENISAWGFCPTEYYVPTYYINTIRGWTEADLKKLNIDKSRWEELKKDRNYRAYLSWKEFKTETNRARDENDKDAEYGDELLYDCKLGLVAGCVWGDDCSWKIQRLDLSSVDKGILTVEESFGYLELGFGLSLKEATRVSEEWSVCFNVQKHFQLKKDKWEGLSRN